MSTFEVSRRAVIEADPARVHDLVADLHQWQAWSPWEGLDPGLVRTYSGADRGVGAQYAWSGNRKAGAGSMEILRADPARIDLTLSFLKPFKATNETSFVLDPTPSGGTTVTWTMRGERSGLMGVVGRVLPIDKLIGKDFEKGLARLDTAART
ncbi:MAG: SRPBCC family protein [Nocardioides sp.]|nr:SRPBCC family protein [Nocardioides sp.]